MGKAERKQRRAARKRIAARRDSEREVAAGVAAHPRGIKSARDEAAAERAARDLKRQRTRDEPSGKKHAARDGGSGTAAAAATLNTGAVFKQLAAERAAGGGQGAAAPIVREAKAAHASSSGARLRL